jgi:hypothetical protein
VNGTIVVAPAQAKRRGVKHNEGECGMGKSQEVMRTRKKTPTQEGQQFHEILFKKQTKTKEQRAKGSKKRNGQQRQKRE